MTTGKDGTYINQTIYVTRDEQKKLRQAVKIAGQSFNGFARLLLLDKAEEIIEVDKEKKRLRKQAIREAAVEALQESRKA